MKTLELGHLSPPRLSTWLAAELRPETLAKPALLNLTAGDRHTCLLSLHVHSTKGCRRTIRSAELDLDRTQYYTEDLGGQQAKRSDEVVQSLRLAQHFDRTQKTSIYWIVKFIPCHGTRDPR